MSNRLFLISENICLDSVTVHKRNWFCYDAQIETYITCDQNIPIFYEAQNSIFQISILLLLCAFHLPKEQKKKRNKVINKK